MGFESEDGDVSSTLEQALSEAAAALGPRGFANERLRGEYAATLRERRRQEEARRAAAREARQRRWAAIYGGGA